MNELQYTLRNRNLSLPTQKTSTLKYHRRESLKIRIYEDVSKSFLSR
jgi:hypothetical protein